MDPEETLAAFPGVDEFYDYRGLPGTDDAPPIWLPIHQGDVFDGLLVPGAPALGDGESPKVMVFMHPCTMRNGATLIDYVTVFRVRRESRKVVPYERFSRHFSVMPLPDLAAVGAGMHLAEFQMVGVVPGESLDRNSRVASLSRDGRLLLMQRVVHHFTRLAAPIGDLRNRTRGVERELELQETWCERACDCHGGNTETVAAAEAAFEAYMPGNDRRDRLNDDAVTHELIAEVYQEIERRYPTHNP